jgi:hypothetical protein
VGTRNGAAVKIFDYAYSIDLRHQAYEHLYDDFNRRFRVNGEQKFVFTLPDGFHEHLPPLVASTYPQA